MAGTLAVTTSRAGSVVKYSLAWTSDASGDVNSTDGDFTMAQGTIELTEFIPDDSDAPTNLYDVDVMEPNDLVQDILGAVGDNRLAASATLHTPARDTYFKVWVPAAIYRLIVANAGNAKKGTVNLYVRVD